MMEKLRLWLIALVVTTFMIAALERITPEGGAKRMLRFASGLLLLVVLLRPLTGGHDVARQASLRYFQAETERLQKQYEAEDRLRAETLIRKKTEAYIEARAAERGLSLRAETELCGEGELPAIESLILHGSRDISFEKDIAAALGIDTGRISWEEGDE